jgi:hypothetical protein
VTLFKALDIQEGIQDVEMQSTFGDDDTINQNLYEETKS